MEIATYLGNVGGLGQSIEAAVRSVHSFRHSHRISAPVYDSYTGALVDFGAQGF